MNATELFRREMKKALVVYYRAALSDAIKRGIARAKLERKNESKTN